MTGKISSIAYCENAIEERWELERRGLVGSHGSAAPPAPEETAPLLADIAARLEAAAAPAGVDPAAFGAAVAKALGKLRAIAPDASFEEIEERLSRVEASLLKSVRKGFSEALEAQVAARVDEALGPAGDVPEAIRERTRRALEKREVRRTAGLPPLTLLA